MLRDLEGKGGGTNGALSCAAGHFFREGLSALVLVMGLLRQLLVCLVLLLVRSSTVSAQQLLPVCNSFPSLNKKNSPSIQLSSGTLCYYPSINPLNASATAYTSTLEPFSSLDFYCKRIIKQFNCSVPIYACGGPLGLITRPTCVNVTMIYFALESNLLNSNSSVAWSYSSSSAVQGNACPNNSTGDLYTEANDWAPSWEVRVNGLYGVLGNMPGNEKTFNDMFSFSFYKQTGCCKT